jgi:hypothetical protein
MTPATTGAAGSAARTAQRKGGTFGSRTEDEPLLFSIVSNVVKRALAYIALDDLNVAQSLLDGVWSERRVVEVQQLACSADQRRRHPADPARLRFDL